MLCAVEVDEGWPLKLYQIMLITEYREHDWPEDEPHKNGQYENNCFECNSIFIGHKRRFLCKVCDAKISEEWNSKTEEEKCDVILKSCELVDSIVRNSSS